MKNRIAAIALLILYILPTVGYSIDTHWCCNKVTAVSIGIGTDAPAKCAMCGMPKKCCKTTHTIVKLKDNQVNSTAAKALPDVSLHAFIILSSPADAACLLNAQPIFQSHSPPYVSKQPVYLTNSVFRV